ncbi:MAG TPA: cytochrome c [Hyphomicrobium sp.]|nr:cytochrome c [Hyphomicrobium sp.]
MHPAPMGKRTTAMCLAASLGLALWSAPALSEPSGVDKGRMALETRCARCHAIGAEGNSPHAQAPPFRDVMKRYAPEDLEESLAEGISSGHPDMPEFVLAPYEISNVVAYLHSLAEK